MTSCFISHTLATARMVNVALFHSLLRVYAVFALCFNVLPRCLITLCMVLTVEGQNTPFKKGFLLQLASAFNST